MKHTRRRHKVDHKTGQELEPMKFKVETPPTPITPDTNVTTETTTTDTDTDPLLIDFSLNKSEEVLLQQNLLNIPFDDKFILQQQIDFINGKFVILFGWQ